jgi:hypothetical protein
MKRYRRVRISRRRGVTRISEVLGELMQELDRMEAEHETAPPVASSHAVMEPAAARLSQGTFSFLQGDAASNPVAALAGA